MKQSVASNLQKWYWCHVSKRGDAAPWEAHFLRI